MGEICPSSAAQAVRVRRQKGLVGGVLPQAPHEPARCVGASMASSWEEAAAAAGALANGASRVGVLWLPSSPFIAAPVAAEAHWRPMLQLRKYAHPPAPGGGAKPQGGWVGEACPSSAALTAKAPWERQAITLALRPLAATCHLRKGLRLPKSASWAHSLPYYWGVRSCQSTLAATVALERLLHPPAPLSVPRHVGRDCCRSEGIPTRPPLFRCQRTLAICAAP